MKILSTIILVFSSLFNQVIAGTDNCNSQINNIEYYQNSVGPKTSPDNKYQFDKIVEDINAEIAKGDSIDLPKVNCLNDLYKRGTSEASKYWAQKSIDEGCISDTGTPKTKPDSCSQKTWDDLKQARKKFKQLDLKYKQKAHSLVGNEIRKNNNNLGSHCILAPLHEKQVEELSKSSEDFKTHLCCGSKDDKHGAVKAVYPEINFNQCLEKIGAPQEEMLSAKGLMACTTNIAKEAVNTIIASLKSLFHLKSEVVGAITAIKEILSNEHARKEFLGNLTSAVGQFFKNRSDSLTVCLNSYEQSMYICELTGSVIGCMADVAAFGKVVKAIRFGKAASAIGDILSQSKKGETVLNGLKKAEQVVVKTTEKVRLSGVRALEKIEEKHIALRWVSTHVIKKDELFETFFEHQIHETQKLTRATRKQAVKGAKEEATKKVVEGLEEYAKEATHEAISDAGTNAAKASLEHTAALLPRIGTTP